MCGRYGFYPGKKFYQRYNIEEMLDRLESVYNVAPGRSMPVVVRNSPNKAVLMRWGLIPHWAKDPKIGFKLINARAETLTEKPAYRSLLSSKRCLVPASGFYEWQKTGEGSIPFYFRRKDDGLLSFAGLYDSWTDAGGKELLSYTIITTEANDVVKPVHERMPVVLSQKDENTWLDPEIRDSSAVVPLLRPYAAGDMESYKVSALVNMPGNDSEMLIRPVTGD